MSRIPWSVLVTRNKLLRFFLSRENDIEDEDEVMADETDDGFSPSQIVKKADIGGLGVDTDTEDVLKEFNFLTQTEVRGVGGVQPSLTILSQAEVGEKGGEWSGGEFQPPAVEQTNLELGELEQLTINNDNDLNYDQVDMVQLLSLFNNLFS